MKKILIYIILSINILFASSLESLKLDENDFMKITSSPKKDLIFKRINKLIHLEKNLHNEKSNILKLNAVNKFFNSYEYKSDYELYGKKDYWAKRKEFIINGAGDCEDYVIAKYFTLIRLGVDESKLFILYNMYENDYHLVLGYQEEQFSDILILDNLNEKILPLTSREDLIIMYTLKLVDLNRKKFKKKDLEFINNYKWSKVYKESKIYVD